MKKTVFLSSNQHPDKHKTASNKQTEKKNNTLIQETINKAI